MNTVKRHVSDDLDELLIQPSENNCPHPLKEMKRACAIKLQSRSAFISLRRRLGYKYFLHKKNLLNENSPIFPRETWLLEQKTQAVPNFCELELEFKGQISLAYANQRTRVLKTRKAKNAALIIGLQKCLCSQQCHTKIRRTLDKEKNDAVSLSEEPPKYTEESISKALLIRASSQCFTVSNMLEQVNQSIDSEMTILKQLSCDLDSRTSHGPSLEVMLQQHDYFKRKSRSENTVRALSEKVSGFSGGVLSPRMIRKWYHQYMDTGGFDEDLCGVWMRDIFLEEHGYTHRFQLYMKNELTVTVDTATKELEAIVQRDPPRTEHGLKMLEHLRPFSRSTVHRWMVRMDCKYDEATETYCRDSHEEKIRKSRKNRKGQ